MFCFRKTETYTVLLIKYYAHESKTEMFGSIWQWLAIVNLVTITLFWSYDWNFLKGNSGKSVSTYTVIRNPVVVKTTDKDSYSTIVTALYGFCYTANYITYF